MVRSWNRRLQFRIWHVLVATVLIALGLSYWAATRPVRYKLPARENIARIGVYEYWDEFSKTGLPEFEIPEEYWGEVLAAFVRREWTPPRGHEMIGELMIQTTSGDSLRVRICSNRLFIVSKPMTVKSYYWEVDRARLGEVLIRAYKGTLQ